MIKERKGEGTDCTELKGNKTPFFGFANCPICFSQIHSFHNTLTYHVAIQRDPCSHLWDSRLCSVQGRLLRSSKTHNAPMKTVDDRFQFQVLFFYLRVTRLTLRKSRGGGRGREQDLFAIKCVSGSSESKDRRRRRMIKRRPLLLSKELFFLPLSQRKEKSAQCQQTKR